MIVLAVVLHSVCRAGNGRVFQRHVRLGVKDWNLDDGISARLEYPMDFFHRPDVIVHMLHHVIAKGDIKGIFSERHVVYVELHFGQWRFDIGGNVVVFVQRFEAIDKA